MQQTETYKLNLIETSDTFSPEPLNENARKLDEILSGKLTFEIGTYTGTGECGSAQSKRNRLEFSFKPVLLVVSPAGFNGLGGYVWHRGVSYGYITRTGSSYSQMYLTWEDRAVSWYYPYNSAAFQLNEEGYKYAYFALGVQE